MGLIQFLEGFKSFDTSDKLYEMASELTKLGVPKDLMQFIHKLTGEGTHLTYRGEKQVIPKSGGKTAPTFHTRQEPRKARGGPWPAREDIPLSHDVQVIGTKKGKKNIFYYLTEILDSRKDIGIRLILVNSTEDQVSYITRKTGKTTLGERQRKYGMDKTAAETRELSRAEGVSEKRGLYIRVVTIDKDSGLPIAAWEGTIGQMAEDWDENTILYIMEQEERVREKRKIRKEIKSTAPQQFLDYFVKNYIKIANKSLSITVQRYRKEFSDIAASMTPEDINDKMQQLKNITEKIKKNKADIESLKPKLWNFLELAFKEGKYKTDEEDINKADLSDFVNKHTLPVAASMFLQFIILNKVNTPFYSDDPIKSIGLDDLFF